MSFQGNAVGQNAAVAEHYRSGHVLGVVRGEERGQIGNVVGFANLLDQSEVFELFKESVQLAIGKGSANVRFDWSRTGWRRRRKQN